MNLSFKQKEAIKRAVPDLNYFCKARYSTMQSLVDKGLAVWASAIPGNYVELTEKGIEAYRSLLGIENDKPTTTQEQE